MQYLTGSRSRVEHVAAFTRRQQSFAAVRVLIAVAVLCSLPFTEGSSQTLQMTPRIVKLPPTDGGIEMEVLVFPGDPDEVEYPIPESWKYRPGATEILFTPAIPQATVQIGSITLQTRLSFDEAGIEKLLAESLKAVPPGAVDAQVASHSPSFGPSKEKWVGYEVILSYSLNGQTFKRAIYYMQRNLLLVRFVTTAREADFEAVREELRGSLYAWQWQPRGTRR